jgi:poly(3-hydroxybutyrate) depolymerase
VLLVLAVAAMSDACGARAPIASFGAPGEAGADAANDASDDGSAATSDATGDAVSASGCGKPLPANQQMTVPGTPKGYTQFTVMATGATLAGPIPAKAGPRTFWVRVPADYDADRRYRVVYIGENCGPSNVANTSTYELYRESSGGTEEAIYVALDTPTDNVNQDCYDILSGPASQEWEAFELVHTFVDEHYCVDNDRVFVAGYGSGGMLAKMWGCYFAGDGQHPANVSTGATDAGVDGDVDGGDTPDVGASTDAGASTEVGPRRFAPKYHIRAQASVSGYEFDDNPPCNGPVAAIWIHDKLDHRPYSGDHDVALPRVLKMNGCYSANPTTALWHEEVPEIGVGVCLKYTDCPAAYPVVFCTTNGFGDSDQHERAIPALKLFFDEATGPP